MSYKKGDIVELVKPKDLYRIIKKRTYGYDVRHIYTDIFECVSESEIRSNNTIDEQTIMFWNLQLQFIEMKSNQLEHVYCAHRDFLCFIEDQYEHEQKATELALHLSGIEE